MLACCCPVKYLPLSNDGDGESGGGSVVMDRGDDNETKSLLARGNGGETISSSLLDKFQPADWEVTYT